MDIGQKFFWVVVIGGILSALVYALVKIGEVVVKRRTAAMIAEHGAGEGDGDEEDGSSPKE